LSEAIGVDLAITDNLGKVLVAAAMANNPRGITLVSSREQKRIEANAQLMFDRRFISAGRQLISALAAEPVARL
jgi:hypothetical protein